MRRLVIALLVLIGADAVAIEPPPAPASHSIARHTEGRRGRRHRRKRRHRRRRHR
jgi:hypothetical protein